MSFVVDNMSQRPYVYGMVTSKVKQTRKANKLTPKDAKTRARLIAKGKAKSGQSGALIKKSGA